MLESSTSWIIVMKLSNKFIEKQFSKTPWGQAAKRTKGVITIFLSNLMLVYDENKWERIYDLRNG